MSVIAFRFLLNACISLLCLGFTLAPAIAAADSKTLGIKAYNDGNYAEAVRLLDEQAHKELAGDCDAMYYRAGAFLRLKRPRWSLICYKKAERLAKNDATRELCQQAIAWLTKAPETMHAPMRSVGKNDRDESNASLIEIYQRTANTDSVYSEVSKAVAALPAKVKRQMSDAGIHWIIVPNLVEYDPALLNAPGRGWGPQFDFSYVAGTFSKKHNAVLIAERARRTADGKMALRGHRMETTLHETGHGYDCVLNHYSRGPVFRAAYENDLPNLSAGERLQYKYFLQAGNPGPCETFAELFAKCVMQKANIPQEIRTDITSVFPRCRQVVDELLK